MGFLPPGRASGKVGVEEDIYTDEQDGIEATYAGPEGVLLGYSAIAWRRGVEERDRWRSQGHT